MSLLERRTFERAVGLAVILGSQPRLLRRADKKSGIGPLVAQSAPRSESLGYVELADDPRYANQGARSGIVFTDLGRPYQGSQVPLEDARAIGRVIGVEFSMEKSTGKSVDELMRRITHWVTNDGIHFVLADLPAAALKDLARGLADRPVMLFNISAPDDD
jgi:hypothetical protein